MAKANQKSLDKMSVEEHKQIVDEQMDATIKVLRDMARASKTIMPLLSSALNHAIELVEMYKESFDKGVDYAEARAKKNKGTNQT